jgi:Protein of unknown function (DUF2510)/Short C-terminal domain
MADANWLADPSGTHELRYWNGSAWTEHVSDRGTTGQDPLAAEYPPPLNGFPPPPTPPSGQFGGSGASAVATAGGKVSWKDRLKQIADQGKAIADQGKQKLAEQNAPPPAAPPQTDMVEQLRKLGELRDAGILTEEEFAAQKAKVLNG